MSTASNMLAFGRAWELQIDTKGNNGVATEWIIGQDSWLPESLRVTFQIEELGYTEKWWGDISIYNLSPSTKDAIIMQGANVTLSAGYQDGTSYGVIFKGKIFQWIWSREDVVDYKLTLHCLAGLDYEVDNMVSFQAQAGASQRDIIMRMMEQAETPIPVESIDSDILGTIVLPRGEIVFGSPNSYLNKVARSNGLQHYFGETGVVIGDITPTTNVSQYTYSSVPDPSNDNKRVAGVNYTIIGTPQQIQNGVEMRVLMDARLRPKVPATNIKIDNTVIRQMLITPPDAASAQSSTLWPALAQDGVYAVASVKHTGDTRGDAWYTDVVGITNQSGILNALGEANSLH